MLNNESSAFGNYTVENELHMNPSRNTFAIADQSRDVDIEFAK
jgi:hypothetical protein